MRSAAGWLMGGSAWLLAACLMVGCSTESKPAGTTAASPEPGAPAARAGQSNITSLQVTDAKVGEGTEARPGRTVTVNYSGWLYDEQANAHKGPMFDSSVGKQPFSFRLGASEVIPGWDQGVAGMKVGGSRTLVIPPALAYGARGAGGAIPPNATLVFDVDLLDVK